MSTILDTLYPDRNQCGIQSARADIVFHTVFVYNLKNPLFGGLVNDQDDDFDPSLHDIELDGWQETYHPIPASRAGSAPPGTPPFLFHGFLRQSSLIMVAADPFVGKTLLLLAMALSLDSGRPLFERFAPAALQPVLFFGQDSPTWDYRGCYQKLVRGLGLSEDEVSQLRSFFFLNHGYELTDPKFIPFLERAKTLLGTRVLMFDTLADFHPFDENSNREMSMLMNKFKYIRDRLDMTILFTHHNAKLAEVMGYSGIAMPRGAGKLSGSSDQILILKRMKTGSVAVTMPKGRGLADFETLNAFTITPGENARGESILTLDPSKTLWDHLLAALTEPRTRDNIVASLSGRYPDLTEKQLYSRVNNALRALSKLGKVKSLSHGLWVAAQPQKGPNETP